MLCRRIPLLLQSGVAQEQHPRTQGLGFRVGCAKIFGHLSHLGAEQHLQGKFANKRGNCWEKNTNQCSGMHFSSFSLNMEWLVGKEAPGAGRLRWGTQPQLSLLPCAGGQGTDAAPALAEPACAHLSRTRGYGGVPVAFCTHPSQQPQGPGPISPLLSRQTSSCFN